MNYKNYKPSGIEWIDDASTSSTRGIPEHWEIKRIKWIYSERVERNRNLIYEEEDLLSVSEYYGVAKRKEKIDENEILNRSESLSEYKIVNKGNLVINIMLAWKKGLGSSDIDGIVSPSYCVYELKEKEFNPRYFHYLYRTDLYAESFKRFSRGIIDSRLRLYSEEFFNIISLLPPPEEQTAIANFLDDKTAKIDSLIEKKKKLIELYKEERTAVINHYVLGQHLLSIDNGQLTIDNYPLSINNYQLPKGWEVKKLKYVAKLEYGESLSSDDRLDGEIPVYGSNGVVGYHSFAITKSPCIIIGRKGSFGKINWSDIPCFPIDTTYYIDQDRCEEDLRFIYFVLLTLNLDSVSKDTGVPGLNRDDAYEKIIFLPPMKEQQQIVEYIEAETKRIDEKIKRTEKEIELLQEYRTALISEVVTGKIDVRNAV